MSERTIAIGDVHGCAKALATLIEASSRPNWTRWSSVATTSTVDQIAGVIALSRQWSRSLAITKRCCWLFSLVGNRKSSSG
jgi:hypothetical protein